MTTIGSILLSVALGCLLVYRFAGLSTLQPHWAAWMLLFGAGASVGIGLASCLFFATPRAALWVRFILLAAAGYECWRRRQAATKQEPLPQPPYTLYIWIAFGIALVIVTSAMSAAWEANPQGNWDAWSIWNLRAKFLAAGGGLAPRAWSPLLSFTHPEYPLLLSGFIASCWSDAGSISELAPIATSYLFFLALLGTVTGGIAVLRGAVPGLLAGLCLMGIPALLTEVPAQYADVPLACFMAGAVLFALLDRPAIAGVLAGFAAWTKDEGQLFLVILFAVIALLRRPTLLRFCYGAAPAGALVLIFKFAMARDTHSLIRGAKVSDWSRIAMVASSMVREIFAWNAGWYHPLMPIAVLAIALRFDRRQQRDSLFCWVVASFLLLGYFSIYAITPNDVQWQLQTSLTRLFVQVCPIVLIAVFIALNVPASPAAPEPVGRRRKLRG